MENKRRKIHEELEVVQEGFANGVAKGFPLSLQEKSDMIEDATQAFGQFLDALKCPQLHLSHLMVMMVL